MRSRSWLSAWARASLRLLPPSTRAATEKRAFTLLLATVAWWPKAYHRRFRTGLPLLRSCSRCLTMSPCFCRRLFRTPARPL